MKKLECGKNVDKTVKSFGNIVLTYSFIFFSFSFIAYYLLLYLFLLSVIIFEPFLSLAIIIFVPFFFICFYFLSWFSLTCTFYDCCLARNSKKAFEYFLIFVVPFLSCILQYFFYQQNFTVLFWVVSYLSISFASWLNRKRIKIL